MYVQILKSTAFALEAEHIDFLTTKIRQKIELYIAYELILVYNKNNKISLKGMEAMSKMTKWSKRLLSLALVCLMLAVTAAPALAVGRSSTLANLGDAYLVTASRLNVRSGPGMENEIIGKAKKGTKVYFLSVSDGWWYVQFKNGNVGYVDKQFLTKTSTPKTGDYTVKKNVTVRSKPRSSGKRLGKLTKGKTVFLSTLNGDWGYIYYNGYGGWVPLKYLKKK